MQTKSKRSLMRLKRAARRAPRFEQLEPRLNLSSSFFFVDDTATRLPSESNRAVRAEMGDIDGDNDLDVIVANGLHTQTGANLPPQDFTLQINNGGGSFTNEAGSRLPGTAFGTKVGAAAILGDVDGDGDLDVFVANGASGGGFPFNYGGFQNRLWINDGSGVFEDQTASRLPAATSSTFDAVFADLDADGDLDVFVGNVGNYGTGQQNRLLINDGTGVFTDETGLRLPHRHRITLAVAAGDLDGDSDLDLVVANIGRSQVLINNGSGLFTEETVIVGDATDVAIADLDGNGDPDLLFATGGPARVLVNSGGGVFTEETSSRIPTSFVSYALALADVDNDGDRDAFFTGGGSEAHLLLNDGMGFFSDATATRLIDQPAGISRSAVFGDVDNDGDPDLYVTLWFAESEHQDRLLMNEMLQPSVLIEPLAANVETLNLHQGTEKRLVGLLNAAHNVLDDLISKNDVAAVNSLNLFIAKVEAERGSSLLQEDADQLIFFAQLIIDTLLCDKALV